MATYLMFYSSVLYVTGSAKINHVRRQVKFPTFSTYDLLYKLNKLYTNNVKFNG